MRRLPLARRYKGRPTANHAGEGSFNPRSKLRAAGFADSTGTGAGAGLDADATAVVVKTDDGSSVTIRVGATNSAKQSYTRREGDPTIYLAAVQTLDSPHPADLAA